MAKDNGSQKKKKSKNHGVLDTFENCASNRSAIAALLHRQLHGFQ